MKTQINILKLVYPPISNQEAEWIKDDPEVRELLEQSNLYMIGQREESTYEIDDANVVEGFNSEFVVPFKYCSGKSNSTVVIDFNELLKHHDFDIKRDLGDYSLKFEFGKKLIRIWKCHPESGKRIDVVSWFTTEKLIYDRWHCHPGINGFDNYRDFTRYYLHYIGISKKDDSLTRLIVKPHDKRLRILSNESSLTFGSRLNDEIILFFFKIEPLRMSIIETDADIDELIEGVTFNKNQIVADAEKAYIHMVESKYNTVKYKNYPLGDDGLYNTGLTRYGYAIGEDITLITDTQEIVGEYDHRTQFAGKADLIFVEGDQVSLIKGVSS